MPHVDIELEDNKQFISNIPRIPVYKISIQYTNPFKTICVTYGTDGTDVRTDSGDTIWPPIENGGGIKKISQYFSFDFCLSELVFYGPVNIVKIMLSQSVNLPKLFPG